MKIRTRGDLTWQHPIRVITPAQSVSRRCGNGWLPVQFRKPAETSALSGLGAHSFACACNWASQSHYLFTSIKFKVKSLGKCTLEQLGSVAEASLTLNPNCVVSHLDVWSLGCGSKCASIKETSTSHQRHSDPWIRTWRQRVRLPYRYASFQIQFYFIKPS